MPTRSLPRPFVLMPKQPKDKARSQSALNFFRFALQKGQAKASKPDYVPLPAALTKQIDEYLSANLK